MFICKFITHLKIAQPGDRYVSPVPVKISDKKLGVNELCRFG